MSDVTIADPYHTGLLEGYMPKGLIFDKVLMAVKTEMDYGRIPKQNTPLYIMSDLQLGPTGFPTIRLSYTATDYYQLQNRGLQVYLSPTDLQQLGGGANARSKSYNQLDSIIKVNREYGLAANLDSTALVTQNFAPSFQYTDYTNSTPLQDFSQAIDVVRTGSGNTTGCGFPPNQAIIPFPAFNRLRRHPDLVKAWLGKFNANYKLTGEQLADILDVKEVLVPEGQYNTNEIGATVSRSDIWARGSIVMAYVNREQTPNEAQQSLGYTMVPAGPDQGLAEFSYEFVQPGTMPQMGVYLVRGFKYQDLILDYTCACLMTSVIA
jgi:hypothetical protein